MEMTVGRVFWHFDILAAYVRLTNPFAGDEDDDEDAPIDTPVEPARMPHRRRRRVTTLTGFEFAEAAQRAGIPVRTGIDVYKSVDAVRVKDPELANLLDDFLKEERRDDGSGN